MTTIRDLLVDMIEDYDKQKKELERTALDDTMPDEIEELKDEIVDEYVDIITKRIVG